MLDEARRGPPPGPPWDLPFAEAPLAFVDLEMTGLRAEVDRVIEVCIERVVSGETVSAFTSLVRPDVWIFGNAHIHGISAEEVQRAPTFAEIAPKVEALLDGAALVAHAAAWDVAFLEAELARAGRPRKIGYYVDTLTLSRRAFSLPSHRLGALAEHFGVARLAAHRAGDDVRVLREVFGHVIATIQPATLRDLWHVRVGEKHARPDVLAAVVHAIEAEVNVVVRFRRPRKPTEELEMRLTQIRSDADPPRIFGYDVRSRSRLELRADRILSVVPAGG